MRDEDLSKASGIEGGVFVHISGFIGKLEGRRGEERDSRGEGRRKRSFVSAALSRKRKGLRALPLRTLAAVLVCQNEVLGGEERRLATAGGASHSLIIFLFCLIRR